MTTFDKMADQTQGNQSGRAGSEMLNQNQQVIVMQKNNQANSRSPVANESINFVIASSGTDTSPR